jgi:hypothetical protein
MSPVELFGELDFGNEYVGDFQGVDEGADSSLTRTIDTFLGKIPKIGKYVNKINDVINNVQ